MRLLKLDSISHGQKLGKSIRNSSGHILINEGVELTSRMIQRLTELNIPYVYVQDPRTENIRIESAISEPLRQEAMEAIETTFYEMQKRDALKNTLSLQKASRRFLGIIRNIMEEVKSRTELITLLADVYTYDNYIFTHSLNVTLYTLAIGLELKLPQKQLETLGLGAILHDVGKMQVPLEILMKPGKLTEDEFGAMKKHSEWGFDLIRNVDTLPLLVAHCAFQHHERLDGSGYPRGLIGDEIHDFGKIIAVADVFDAVTSHRVYRTAMLPHEGLEILYAGAGRQFDVKIIDAFRKSVAIYPNGLGVILNDGRKGVVSSQNKGMSDRPVVRILEEQGMPVSIPYEIDLSGKIDVVITGCDTAIKETIKM
ncbi:HD-GYP domain-containing protein [Peribacillus sp. SCS-155]|uniref:HD-GYP domain-containing protein n=1 Tax=Peribacillus sedimenti TaxID=3115297 RepID=UPI0039060565